MKQLNLPDAINCSKSKNYTAVPNDFLRDPNISSKAKVILSILLSNRKGWHSYIVTLQSMMKENNVDTIRKCLNELEQLGYLKRIYYRNKTSKIRLGSFWVYADVPHKLDFSKNLEYLRKHNLEVFDLKPKNQVMGKAITQFSRHGFSRHGKTSPKNTNNKKTNNKKTNIYIFGEIFRSKKPQIDPIEKVRNKIPPKLIDVEIYCKLRNNGINAQDFIDFYTSKGWMIGKNKMKDWQAAIRTWERSQYFKPQNHNPPKVNGNTYTPTDELPDRILKLHRV